MSLSKLRIGFFDLQPESLSVWDRCSMPAEKGAHIESSQQLLDCVTSKQVHVLVLSVFDDLELLRSFFKQSSEALVHCPVVVVVGRSQVSLAIEAMRLGADEVIENPEDIQTITDVIELVGQSIGTDFICDAEQTRQLLALASRVAQTDVTVLINGESGTGKEVLAKHIHSHSARANKPFVAVNCASIPESMLEDMLFGHEKGAFTGAHQRHAGLFEQAHHGTIFLDEIGEMPLVLQAKILRVLQERELRRLGGSDLISLDLRVIAATNRNLAERVRDREFREDLFYRLNVFPLKVMPLRERQDDVLPIAHALLSKHRGITKRNCKLSRATQSFLKTYSWPGNVRELENVIQRAMVLAVDGIIEVEHLLLETHSHQGDISSLNQEELLKQIDPVFSREQQQAAALRDLPLEASASEALSSTQPEQQPQQANEGLSDLTWKSESRVIIDTLSRFSGNRKNTAEQLGISPRTLRYKLARLKEEGVALP